jgi:class 3 adenylate cyclase
MDVPKTRWAATIDGASIAYQDFGAGPVTLVCMMGGPTHLEIEWEYGGHVAFMRRLARNMRVLNFDKRGTGMSDRIGAVPDLETRMDDVRAVMDAAGVERAAILGMGTGGPQLGAAFAATHPDRALALFIRGWLYEKRTPENPMGLTETEAEEWLEAVTAHWGDEGYAREEALLLLTNQELAVDTAFAVWTSRVDRFAATPTSFAAFYRMWFETDVRDLLPTIHVPTFVVTLRDAPEAWHATARHYVSLIPCAQLKEIAGEMVPLELDDPDPFVSMMEEAIASIRQEEAELERRLATVLFTDVVGSTSKAAELGDHRWAELLERHNLAVRAMLARYRGQEVSTAGDSFMATFDGPARAVRCARGICEAVKPLGLEVRAGCHTGEIELLGADVGGIAVHIGARVGALAGPSEVLVSSTVKDLVAGSGLVFEDRGEHELKGVPDPWHLYAVVA